MAKPNILDALAFFAPHSKNKPRGVYGVKESLLASGEPWKYLLGTIYHRCTQALLERIYKEHYRSWNKAKFMRIGQGKIGFICTDCQGAFDAFFTQVLGIKTDINAAMNYSDWCSPDHRGSDMKKMPKLIGTAVYRHNGSKISHIGTVIGFTFSGDPLIFEAKSYTDDVLITEFSKGTWNRWGIMDKKFDYSEAQKVTEKLLQKIGAEKPEPATAYPYAVRCESKNGGNVNLRSKASTSSTILARIPSGTKMQATTNRAINSWYRVKVNGKEGYMHGDYVKVE